LSLETRQLFIWLPLKPGSANIGYCWIQTKKSGGTMKSLLKNLVIIVMLASLSFLTVSCNTMQGVGEDLETAGEKIQQKAD
jgi:predicted small secreted protein